MKLHRFYVPELKKSRVRSTHVQDGRCLYQWRVVLRYRPGQQVILFNGVGYEAVYEIKRFDKNKVTLAYVETLSAQAPTKHTYLLWSLLKKDNNEWLLQKATEIGVTHFVPVIAQRCERADVSRVRADRWQKIIIEAAEQCGRSDIPQVVLEPIELPDALRQYQKVTRLYVADQHSTVDTASKESAPKKQGVLIGPEGGWSDSELELFESFELPKIQLGQFVLRAETAAIVAAARMLQ